MSIELVTLIMFGGLMVCLMAGIPIAFSMAVIGVGITTMLWGYEGPKVLLYNTMTVITTLPYMALPLFIFMGVVLERSGIADALFEMMYRWSGPVRGGIAMGTVVICTIFAAMTGVTGAATVTMGLIALPAMLNRRYSKSLALGTVAGPGTLGLLIPPSAVIIILAPIAHISVGQTFMGGVFPGLLLAGLFIAYIGIRSFFQPHLAPAHGEKFTLRQKIISTKAVILPGLVIIAVLGSIFLGMATPTEAAAVGAFACLIAVIIRRRLTLELIKNTSFLTLEITGMCMWIVFGAIAFSSAFNAAGGVDFISGLILGISANRWVVVLMTMVVVFFLGCFLDPLATIFLVVPIAFPMVETLGFDLTWFAILFMINVLMGTLTPPYGYQLFYLKSVAPPGVSIGDIYRSVLPFLGIMVLGMALTMLFPQIVTWLPEQMMEIRLGR